MKHEIIATGRDVQEAKQNAATLLGVDDTAENIVYEVLELPKSGFLGLGAKPAKARGNISVMPAMRNSESLFTGKWASYEGAEWFDMTTYPRIAEDGSVAGGAV